LGVYRPVVRVVVCGGSVAGQSAALLLHRRGHDVTVLERDGESAPIDVAAAWEQWDRRGVPQFRQFHAFAPRARQTLLRELPDVHAGLLDAGFTETPMAARIRMLFPESVPEAGDDEIVALLGRRTTFEWVLRRALEDSGVEIRLGSSVDGVVRTGSRVAGVRCAGTQVSADLVVDATGRRSVSERWLAEVGLPAGQTVRTQSGIVYYSRWYRLRHGVDFPGNVIRTDLLSLRAMLTPADDGFASLAISAAVDDDALKPLRRVPAFQAVAQELPLIGEWVRPERATPVTDVLFMGNLENRYRTLIDAAHEPILGIVAIGDASTVTNPVFGRGVALGVTHAATLVRVLDETDVLAELAERFCRSTEETMRPWWEESVREDDLRQLWLRAARGDELAASEEQFLATDEAMVHRALPIAMMRDPAIFRLVIRNLTSLDPPDRLHAREVAVRALSLVSQDELTAAPISRDDLLSLLAST
jgi:2-polyprenyl-6-methoxyphenol hydroxylase-like FAD-dependent oxidoreductase